MKTDRIDLYNYFGLTRPDGAAGYLDIMLIDEYPEFAVNRIRPAMLVIGGGAYAMVSQREKEPVALKFIAEGYNAFILEYSTNPVHFPYQLIEACMATAYIRENADALSVNPEKVCAVGFSAGGHLCGMLATLFDHQQVKKALKDKANLCRPDAVILSYPVISSGEFSHVGSFNNLCGEQNDGLKKELSLEFCVNKNSAPAFIWSTVEDKCVPCENSLFMALAYRKAGVPFELHVYEKGNHGISICTDEVNTPNEQAKSWINLSVNWLKNKGFYIKKKGE